MKRLYCSVIAYYYISFAKQPVRSSYETDLLNFFFQIRSLLYLQESAIFCMTKSHRLRR